MKRIWATLRFVLLACHGCGGPGIQQPVDGEVRNADCENTHENEPISFSLDGALGFVELSDELDVQPSFWIDRVYKNPDNIATGEKEDPLGNMNIETDHAINMPDLAYNELVIY